MVAFQRVPSSLPWPSAPLPQRNRRNDKRGGKFRNTVMRCRRLWSRPHSSRKSDRTGIAVPRMDFAIPRHAAIGERHDCRPAFPALIVTATLVVWKKATVSLAVNQRGIGCPRRSMPDAADSVLEVTPNKQLVPRSSSSTRADRNYFPFLRRNCVQQVPVIVEVVVAAVAEGEECRQYAVFGI